MRWIVGKWGFAADGRTVATRYAKTACWCLGILCLAASADRLGPYRA